MDSYLYSPGQYMLPVEKAKNLVEMFKCVPESNTHQKTTDAAETCAESAGMSKFLKHIQIDKQKEASQKEVPLDTHGFKRKGDEDTQNVSAKCLRMATSNNGEAEEVVQGRLYKKCKIHEGRF